jgi:cell division protein ZapA
MEPDVSAAPRPSTVTIFGSEYRIRGPADSDYGRQVAELVDSRMREVADHQRIQSPLRVAILTLLNLTDELMSARRHASHLAAGVEERAQKLAEILRSALDDSGVHPSEATSGGDERR